MQDYALFLLDPAGRVASWNQGAEHIEGYRSEEIVGRHFCLFYTREDVESGKPDLALEAAVTTGHLEDEGWRVRKDGSRVWRIRPTPRSVMRIQVAPRTMVETPDNARVRRLAIDCCAAVDLHRI